MGRKLVYYKALVSFWIKPDILSDKKLVFLSNKKGRLISQSPFSNLTLLTKELRFPLADLFDQPSRSMKP